MEKFRGELTRFIDGLYEGERKFGTIFGGTDIEDCAETLIKHGFNYSGKDLLYSGGC